MKFCTTKPSPRRVSKWAFCEGNPRGMFLVSPCKQNAGRRFLTRAQIPWQITHVINWRLQVPSEHIKPYILIPGETRETAAESWKQTGRNLLGRSRSRRCRLRFPALTSGEESGSVNHRRPRARKPFPGQTDPRPNGETWLRPDRVL